MIYFLQSSDSHGGRRMCVEEPLDERGRFALVLECTLQQFLELGGIRTRRRSGISNTNGRPRTRSCELTFESKETPQCDGLSILPVRPLKPHAPISASCVQSVQNALPSRAQFHEQVQQLFRSRCEPSASARWSHKENPPGNEYAFASTS